MKKLIIILCTAWLASACNKKEPVGYTKQTAEYETVFTFWNNGNGPLQVDVYRNSEDYKHSRNAVFNFTIEGKGQYRDSAINWQKEDRLYLDIYKKDKTTGNWGLWTKLSTNTVFDKDEQIERGFAYLLLYSAGSGYDYLIPSNVYSKINPRNLFINGNAPETVWKA